MNVEGFPAFALRIDPEGREVSSSRYAQLVLGDGGLDAALDPNSRAKLLSGVTEARRSGRIPGWEVNLTLGDEVRTFVFDLTPDGDDVLAIGHDVTRYMEAASRSSVSWVGAETALDGTRRLVRDVLTDGEEEKDSLIFALHDHVLQPLIAIQMRLATAGSDQATPVSEVVSAVRRIVKGVRSFVLGQGRVSGAVAEMCEAHGATLEWDGGPESEPDASLVYRFIERFLVRLEPGARVTVTPVQIAIRAPGRRLSRSFLDRQSRIAESLGGSLECRPSSWTITLNVGVGLDR